MSLLYTFNSTVEDWTLEETPTDPATLSHDATTGDPVNGCIKVVMPSGGGAENPNGAESVISPVQSNERTGQGQVLSFRYRINNTGASRNFNVNIDLREGSGATRNTVFSASIALTSLSGDSGWRELVATVDDSYDLKDITIDFSNTSDNTGDYTFYVDTVSIDTNKARFYQGAGTLDFKFVLPFEGVHPAAFTLDKALGTIVIGSDAPAGVPIASSPSPYVTGTATATNFPTGSTITGLDWI